MKFFKYILLAGISLFSFASCMMDRDVFDFQVQWEIDKATIREYVVKRYPNAVEHEPTGIWYELLEEGEPGSYIYKINQQTNYFIFPMVTMRYQVRLLDSDEVVQEEMGQEGVEIRLANDVEEALLRAFFPKKIGGADFGLLDDGLQIGAKIRIFTPSYFAYGNQSKSGIPANSPLFFYIEVLDIKE